MTGDLLAGSRVPLHHSSVAQIQGQGLIWVSVARVWCVVRGGGCGVIVGVGKTQDSTQD